MDYQKTIKVNADDYVTVMRTRGRVALVLVRETDYWRDRTHTLLNIDDAKRLRNYLTEAINFAIMYNEEDK